MFGWKWGNLVCDSCQRPGGLTGMQIGHTIVALNLPSRSMLRIVTALSWCPPSSHPETVCVCLWGREMGDGGANRVAIIQQGNLSKCKGGRVQGWKWYQILGCSVWWPCMPPPPRLLSVVTVQLPWHCSPPQFRSAACAQSVALNAVLNDS